MTTAEEGLRDASDTLVASLDRLSALETEKRRLLPDDPRLLDLASKVEALAAEVLRTAKVQSQLVETTHVMAMVDDPQAPSGPIDPSARPLYVILEDWRAAERALASATPGSPEAAEASVRARGLRAEYHRTFEETHREPRER